MTPNPAGSTEIVEASLLAQENHLLAIVRQYMAQAEVEQVSLALQLAQDTCKDLHDSLSPTSIPPLEHALAVATILADMHIDAVGIAAGLLFEAIDAERLALERVENILSLCSPRPWQYAAPEYSGAQETGRSGPGSLRHGGRE